MNARTQMKLLVNLAKIDGTVAEREKNYIINIARANGIYPDEVLPLFEMEHEVVLPQDLTNDEKFECIYSLVQLMKIDERMYQEEIRFCSTIATKLGYDQQVLFELMLHVSGDKIRKKEMNELKEIVQKFLNR